MKYEYLLNTWGGFYNDEHFKKHGQKEGAHFFSTKELRQEYLDKLRKLEKKLKASVLVCAEYEGTKVRYRTVAKVTYKYKGVKFKDEIDFEHGYPEDSAIYMITEGNYCCDCNRSLFLGRKHKNFPELNCGREIVLSKFEIVKIK